MLEVTVTGWAVTVLMVGIVGALVLRTAFIALGAELLDLFSPTYLIFGLALIGTGAQLSAHRDKDLPSATTWS